jgi:putative transposase
MLDLALAFLPSCEPRAGGAAGRHAIHRVEFATFALRRRFADGAVAARATQRLRALTPCPQARVLAWVLLPDRWLGVVEAATAPALADHVERVKAALVPGAAGAACIEPAWANAFHARLVRDDVALAQAARDILDAPVRVGLAMRRGEYAFWDAEWHPHARVAPAESPELS